MTKRGLRWQFLVAFLFALSLASLSFGESTLFQHQDQTTPDLFTQDSPIAPSTGTMSSQRSDKAEFDMINHSIQFPVISTGTAKYLAITSATITNLTVGTLTTSGTLGKIVQIVPGTSNGSTSTTSTSFVNTALAVSITPKSASNNILVFVTSNYFDNTGAFFTCLTLNSSVGGNLTGGSSGFACTVAAGTNQNNGNASYMFPESPATTSAVTYTLQVRTSNAGGTARSNTGGGYQVIVAIEYIPT